MTQENGMPTRFELIDKQTGEVASNDLWTINFATGEPTYNKFFYVLRQAIGATDSSDPKQELYFGDLIGFNLDKKDVVGEIIWLNFSVWVRLWRNENTLSYLSMSHILDYFKIKRLGSSHDLKMKEVWEKAGLEKS